MTTSYLLYMAEANGYDKHVTTRTAKINGAIKDLIAAARRGVDINEYGNDILLEHGVPYSSLTNKEINLIKREVEKRV